MLQCPSVTATSVASQSHGHCCGIPTSQSLHVPACSCVSQGHGHHCGVCFLIRLLASINQTWICVQILVSQPGGLLPVVTALWQAFSRIFHSILFHGLSLVLISHSTGYLIVLTHTLMQQIATWLGRWTPTRGKHCDMHVRNFFLCHFDIWKQ